MMVGCWIRCAIQISILDATRGPLVVIVSCLPPISMAIARCSAGRRERAALFR